MTVFGISCIRLSYERVAGIDVMMSLSMHRLAPDALHVDDRRLAGDGDRLLERADLQLGVDRRGERAGQLDAFAPNGLKPGQRERRPCRCPAADRRCGTGRDSSVTAVRTFSISRAGRFDGHAGQHGARRILDDAGNRRLGVRG